MIAYIKGNIEYITEQAIYVNVNGIGYEIFCANPFVFQDQLGEKIQVFTYHYIREDAQILYGFKKTDDKTLFAKLLNVSGIGPKGALAIMGSVRVEEFAAAIEREDEKFLTSFPGVGKKTARQMILDLKGKLPFEVNIPGTDSKEDDSRNPENSQALEEAMEAMKALGYSEREIKEILPSLKKESLTNADAYIRKGLALMMQKS